MSQPSDRAKAVLKKLAAIANAELPAGHDLVLKLQRRGSNWEGQEIHIMQIIDPAPDAKIPEHQS